jgi:hypothetical protein
MYTAGAVISSARISAAKIEPWKTAHPTIGELASELAFGPKSTISRGISRAI